MNERVFEMEDASDEDASNNAEPGNAGDLCTSLEMAKQQSHVVFLNMEISCGELQGVRESNFEQYRPSVAAVIVNMHGDILIGERSDMADVWQMPQGGVDAPDPLTADLWQELKRELREELTLQSEQLQLQQVHPLWHCYDYPQKPSDPQKASFKGQVQKWHLVWLLNGDVNLEAAQDREFTQVRWVSPDAVLQAAPVFRRPIYAEVLHHFKLL